MTEWYQTEEGRKILNNAARVLREEIDQEALDSLLNDVAYDDAIRAVDETVDEVVSEKTSERN